MFSSIIFVLMRSFALLISLYLIISLNNTVSAQYMHRAYISIEPTSGRMMNFEDKEKFEDKIHGVDISYNIPTYNNSSEWIKRLNVKFQQTAFTYMNQNDLDGMLDTSKNAFGDVFMLTHSLLIGILNKEKNAIYFIPGFGIAYDTKTYYTDFRNIFIGSHFNYAIRLESQYHYHLFNNNVLIVGLKYMHYSNGAIILPNRGINSLSLKLGYAFKL